MILLKINNLMLLNILKNSIKYIKTPTALNLRKTKNMIKILKETKGKDSVVKDNSKSKTSKELPETGSKQESNSNSLVFSLIALLSSLLLLKRKTIKYLMTYYKYIIIRCTCFYYKIKSIKYF